MIVLELLSHGKVEFTAMISSFRFTAGNIPVGQVKSVTPVNAKHTKHGKECPNANTGGTFYTKGIEFLKSRPGITAFNKSQVQKWWPTD